MFDAEEDLSPRNRELVREFCFANNTLSIRYFSLSTVNSSPDWSTENAAEPAVEPTEEPRVSG